MANRRASAQRAPLLALASAVLLIVAFPSFNQPWAAWVALAPWLVLLRRTHARAAFLWSFLIGILFFLGSMWWLIHVTLLGWLLLTAYQALYFGLFGWLVALGWAAPARATGPQKQRLGTDRPWGKAYAFAGIPAIWVALEYARSHLLSGLGWNLLAYSQAPQLHVIQLADLTGAWGVSFVIVLVNVSLAEMADAVAWAKEKRIADQLAFQRATAHVTWAILSLLIVMGYGSWRLANVAGEPAVRVTVVQGNIPQEEKWDEARLDSILARYETLTRAAAQAGPQLIVWPETSVPGYLGLDEPLTRRIVNIAGAAGTLLLVGAPHARPAGAEWTIMNGAALVDAAGVSRWHDKLHLVPFGEFIPLERMFPWLRELLPPIGDFVPGQEYTVFHVGSGFGVRGSGQLSFSVLVCFEDLFPELSRRFVREGARLLLVITNDAWFGPTAAAYQHAQASTLRAVELRVPVVRAANTGWSGCIDAAGRWTGSVRDASGAELFVAGAHSCEVAPGPAE
ncbi:MAG: apolipoprotein N-acyltransferase, partial [Omnitrophica WOR_2 bacterium RIFCSPHIGHO2_02_FULL_68_15]